MDGWMDGWVGGCLDGWMDRKSTTLFTPNENVQIVHVGYYL